MGLSVSLASDSGELEHSLAFVTSSAGQRAFVRPGHSPRFRRVVASTGSWARCPRFKGVCPLKAV